MLNASINIRESSVVAQEKMVEHLLGWAGAIDRRLLLISGGSNLNVAIEFFRRLPKKHQKNLVIGLVDERYGEEKDSNDHRLRALGFNPGDYGFTYLPILAPRNSPINLAESYASKLMEEFSQAERTAGLFGIGIDGHTAGIKPQNPDDFSRLLGPSWVASYQADDFVRITITAEVIKRLDAAFVYATGASKYRSVENLLEIHWPHLNPEQILKLAEKIIIETTKE